MSHTLRTLRVDRGITGVELARLSQIHPADISRLEHGRTLPYKPQVERLAKALGVSEDSIRRCFPQVLTWK